MWEAKRVADVVTGAIVSPGTPPSPPSPSIHAPGRAGERGLVESSRRRRASTARRRHVAREHAEPVDARGRPHSGWRRTGQRSRAGARLAPRRLDHLVRHRFTQFALVTPDSWPELHAAALTLRGWWRRAALGVGAAERRARVDGPAGENVDVAAARPPIGVAPRGRRPTSTRPVPVIARRRCGG